MATASIPISVPRGRYVLFTSTASNLVNGDDKDSEDMFVRDRENGETISIDGARDVTPVPVISAEGVFAFAADDSSAIGQIFVHDRQTSDTTLASVAQDGTPGNAGSYWPAMAADGRYVVFISDHESRGGGH